MAIILAKRRPDANQRFPFIPLPRAIDRARELYKVANGHEVPFATAATAWSYAEKSSGASQTAAALKAFGLLVDVPGSDVRKVQLTEPALRVLRDPRDISPERDALIRDCALRPALHREVIEKYKGMPPSDEALKAYLLMDRGLKDEAVPEFLREFTTTMAFAKIADSGSIQDISTAIDDMIEAPSVDPPTTALSAAGARGTFVKAQPTGALPITAMAPSVVSSIPLGMRREIFGLDEGDVVLTFPESLSPESYQDLADHLELFLRKAKRRASTEQQHQRDTDE